MSEDNGSQIYRSTIEYGRDTLKAAMIMNGAAAVALLAFIGNNWSDFSDASTNRHLIRAFSLFCLGISTSVLSFLVQYVLQNFLHLFYGNKLKSRKSHELGDHLYFRTEEIDRKISKTETVLFRITFFLLIFSFGFFFIGMFEGYNGISSLLSLSARS